METRIMERKFVGHKMARREFFSNVIHVYIYIYIARPVLAASHGRPRVIYVTVNLPRYGDRAPREIN